jgi:hypothetical protein
MKKLLKVFILLLSAAVFLLPYGCDDFKMPKSKEASNAANLFSNLTFNNIGLIPPMGQNINVGSKLCIRPDYSGYIIYTINGQAADLKESILNAVDEVNKTALGEGDYQQGYRVIYVREKNIKQREGYVTVTVEFKNINHLKCEVKVQTVEEYLVENPDDDENNKFTGISSDKVSLIKIENKSDYYIAVCNGILNQAPIETEGCTISAYYTQNSTDYAQINKNTIRLSTGTYKFIFTPTKMPLWLIIGAIAVIAAFIVVLTIKLAKVRK